MSPAGPIVSTPPPTSSLEVSQPVSASTSQLEIPGHWRPEVEDSISNQQLTNPTRAEIVRVLVTILFSRFSKPTRPQIGAMARKLILKYPFMKDDLGNGYVSQRAY